MAKPIESTPVITGDDVRIFLETIRKEDAHPDPKRLKLIAYGEEVFSRIRRK
ncbi:MAG: hypothetical protein V1827_02015 [Candidatus Micrarchaeota archaeon]